MEPIDTSYSGRRFFLVCSLLILLLCVGCTRFISHPQSFEEALTVALSNHLQIFQKDAPVVITDILLLAESLRKREKDAFSSFCEQHDFIPVHMTADEYAKRLYRSTKRLLVETDSMEIVFSDTQVDIATIRAEIILDSSNASEDSTNGQPVFSGDVRISFEHFSTTCPEPCVPTLAKVSVMTRLLDTATGEWSNSVNIVFFEKKEGTWVIVSFQKDLLNIVEGR